MCQIRKILMILAIFMLQNRLLCQWVLEIHFRGWVVTRTSETYREWTANLWGGINWKCFHTAGVRKHWYGGKDKRLLQTLVKNFKKNGGVLVDLLSSESSLFHFFSDGRIVLEFIFIFFNSFFWEYFSLLELIFYPQITSNSKQAFRHQPYSRMIYSPSKRYYLSIYQ